MQHTLHVIPVTGKFINAVVANDLIANWQQANPQGIFSILYGRHLFDNILANPDCVGIRISNGINQQGKQAFVIVGVDKTSEPILTSIWDLGVPCPPYCGTDWPKRSYLWRQPIDPSLNMQQIGKRITLDTAQQMINDWQEQQPEGMTSFQFSREMIETLLEIPACEGIAIYNGMDTAQSLILLAADATGRCIVDYTRTFAEGTELLEAPILNS